jgi:REP element-mobilizing transposase RayT
MALPPEHLGDPRVFPRPKSRLGACGGASLRTRRVSAGFTRRAWFRPSRVFSLSDPPGACGTLRRIAETARMPTILFVHLSWTTVRRMPMVGLSEARFLGRFLPAEAKRLGAAVIATGMVCDHVHLVLRIPGRIDMPRLVQGLKGASARLANKDQTISLTGLRWAHGYHLVSVSPRNLQAAVAYVKGQSGRHPDRAIGGLEADD